jgi:hypothetical protein
MWQIVYRIFGVNGAVTVTPINGNGPAIKGVCGAESNGGGESKLAMKKIPPEP